jgi:hypothetical protein
VCLAAAQQARRVLPAHPRDAGKALGVSRYVDDDPHVRFRVWDETGRVEGAVSVDELEAQRVARFLRPPIPHRRHALASLLDYAAGVSARRSSTGSRKTTSS